MLRITIEKRSKDSAFKLEGRLAGPWVDELERAWSAVTAEQPSTGITVELCDVLFIDAEGRRLLERMYEQGVQLKASGCLMNSIIEEIKIKGVRK
jgi:hypothetical protein